ncbi:MAG: type II toxin-antitoxin system RelE/ParE family toxin [Bacteroidota bacterium]
MAQFDVLFLEPVKRFLDHLDDVTRKKVLFNIWKSREVNDSELLKKLNRDIWEFRTRYGKKQIRLLAFWDKRRDEQTLVIVTHGFFKKTRKTPIKEIARAEKMRTEYLE